MKKKSLQETNPDLSAQWHPSKNGALTPSLVTKGSGRKVWWKCPEGDDHEWPAIIANRVKSSGCPICSHQRVAKSTSLGTVRPDLAAEWHPTKNGGVTPFEVLPSSSRKVWWQCSIDSGHEWEAKLNNRFHGKGCPICSNQKIIKQNSLGSINPRLAAQWHPTKNGDLTPYDVAPSGTNKVWWKCPKGDDHEWIATINHRSSGTGCPLCNPTWSVAELRIYTELKTIFPSIEHRAVVNGIEVDIYLAELKFGIEYDGIYWHKNKTKKDKEKNSKLENLLFLLRVREKDLQLIGPKDISITKNKLSIKTIKKILNVIQEKCSLSKKQQDAIATYQQTKTWIATASFNQIFSERKTVKQEKSLEYLYPELAREWHPIKNQHLTPNQFSPGSGRKVWWLGQCNHEWEDSILHRTSGRGCPKCRYKKASRTRRKNKTKDQQNLF